MSVQTLYTAATGMEALETKLDVIANNMANINTTAFKKDRANFEDLFYRQYRLPGAEDADGGITSTGIEVGLGSRVSSTQTNYVQGAMQVTNNPLDWAIEGRGFFKVNSINGPLYTRSGNFGVDANGQIVMGSATQGWILDPPINIPDNATGVVVATDGQVSYSTSDSTSLIPAGQLFLTTFINPDGLLKMGDGLYQATDSSGIATEANPGQPGMGNIRQGALEASNVEPVQELIDLITTQRAFELNSQVVQAGDQIMQVAANLRRF
ncbi:flagellar basal-body rod protein FlgG [Bythopirellula goksoeyrii]|uniref:Flagellar basal-body rod protein FlgG n=1 Tax=Bythopirellula goksoeyrii TaxID=1400387 RepID=A0A5B9Q9S4_9BACT|nr:flagellar basal-body rod protein FlgG [Bythopirellula goksoeyrii]QEG34182.1 Flagellar basal-body rod protein FlgG [Bythopirellula goksoeyrii]